MPNQGSQQAIRILTGLTWRQRMTIMQPISKGQLLALILLIRVSIATLVIEMEHPVTPIKIWNALPLDLRVWWLASAKTTSSLARRWTSQLWVVTCSASSPSPTPGTWTNRRLARCVRERWQVPMDPRNRPIWQACTTHRSSHSFQFTKPWRAMHSWNLLFLEVLARPVRNLRYNRSLGCKLAQIIKRR